MATSGNVDLPFDWMETVVLELPQDNAALPGREPHAGEQCPQCQQAVLDYDGTLSLVCPKCGFGIGGCFT